MLQNALLYYLKYKKEHLTLNNIRKYKKNQHPKVW